MNGNDHFEEIRVLYPARITQLRKEREDSIPPITDVVKEAEAWTVLALDLFDELALSGNKAVAQLRGGIAEDKARDEELRKTFDATQRLVPNTDLDTLRKQIRGFDLFVRLFEAKIIAKSHDAMVASWCRLLQTSDQNVLFEILGTLIQDIIRLFTEPPAFSFIRDEIEKVSEILKREERERRSANAYVQRTQDYSTAMRTWCVLAVMLANTYETFPRAAAIDPRHALAACSSRHAAIASKLAP